MKTFKAKHKKGFYKSTDAWINAVYRNNKEVISKELGSDGKSGKVIFKQMIKEYMSEGLSPTKAVSTIARSTIFTSTKERLLDNFYKGLKSDQEAYKTFKELIKEKGKYTKFDTEKLFWNPQDKVYIYDNSVIISFQNSPYGVKVRDVR